MLVGSGTKIRASLGLRRLLLLLVILAKVTTFFLLDESPSLGGKQPIGLSHYVGPGTVDLRIVIGHTLVVIPVLLGLDLRVSGVFAEDSRSAGLIVYYNVSILARLGVLLRMQKAGL